MSDLIKNYGYYDYNIDQNRTIYSAPVQSVAGYPIGIIGLELFYPLIPGNVANPWTYDFPTRFKIVKGATVDRIFANDPTLLDDFLAAGDELIAEGCRAITGCCGYFANFQKEMAAHFDVPTAMTSLVQVPWIKTLLKPDQKIGIVCANGAALSDHTLESAGITDKSILVYHGLDDSDEFGRLVHQEDGVYQYNPQKVGMEVVERALQLQRDNNLGAILLECSDLPPFAHMVARATNLPVFDYTTLHEWMYRGVCRKPFQGFY